MNEKWKPIDGFEQYEVSDQGRVRHGEKILRPRNNGRGYLRVSLCRCGKIKQFSVHRLVCDAFVENPYSMTEIHHIDEDKNNNSASNLEWCNRKYNNCYGTRLEKIRKPVKCVETGDIFSSATEAERKTGIFLQSICRCVKGELYTAGGYHWISAENERK